MNDNSLKVVEVDINEILPNRFQPRIQFDEDEILELSDSIREHGVIQPLVVRMIGDKYEIIAGERRYKASVLSGKDTVPVIIKNFNDKESAEIALIENIQRKNLTPIEEALYYRKILDMGYLTQEVLATKIGKSQSSVANKLRLLNLSDEVQDALLENKISERHARSLLKLSSEKDQNKLLEKIIAERLTVRKTDEEIDKIKEENSSDIIKKEKEEIDMNNDFNDIPSYNMNNGTVNAFETNSLTNNNSFLQQSPSLPSFEAPQASTMPSFEAPQASTMPSFGAPQASTMPSFGAPQASTMPSFGAPQASAMSSFEAPQASTIPSFGAPQASAMSSFEAPQASTMSSFEAPQASAMPSFEAPQASTMSSFEAPQASAMPSFEAPQASTMPSFGVPQASSQEAILPNTNPIQEDSNNLKDDFVIPSLNINNNVFNSSPTVNEPIIVTDYEKQYDPIMPQIAEEEPIKVDFKEIINMIRECSKKIEEYGYKLDLEEYDLANMYQVVFKIDK